MTERTLHLKPAEPGGSTCTVTVAEVVLGRGADCHCAVGHESVSRRHVEITLGVDDWIVRDLGSTHGTFVNGVRVDGDESVPLRAGDGVRLGTVEFLVELEGPGFPPPPAPPSRPEPTKPSVSREEFQTRGSLLLRLGDGDAMVRELSWQAFHDQYAPIIRGFARNAGCPASSIDDVIHEVMANFFRAAERFEYDASKGRFRGYLKTATINSLRKRHKKASREPRAEVDPNLFADGSDVADAMWTRAWRSQMLERAIAFVREETRMTDQSLDAFELCAVRGVPVEEAARQLGLTPDATQKAKNRVAAAVREELERIRLEEG